MAHFAKVLGGKVINVIVADDEFFNTFVDDSPGEYIQTSYNTAGGLYINPESREVIEEEQNKALRKNFAGVGFTYDRERDAFIPPQIHNSWVLNEDSCLWEPPIAKPDDGRDYLWNEETTSWQLIE